MTLRDDLRSLIAGRADAAIDAEGGLSDLSPELTGTALGHFADTAPLEVADSLAPVVMATGPVPFDAELDGVTQVDDPLAMFDSADTDPALLGIDSAEPADGSFGVRHEDPSDRDGGGGPGVDERRVAGDDLSHGSMMGSDDDGSFGSGAGVAGADLDRQSVGVSDAGLLDVDSDAATRAYEVPAADDFVDGAAGLIDDPVVVDFDPMEIVDDVGDLDPMDDDLDLAD